MWRWLSPAIRFGLIVAAINVLAFVALRLVFLLVFHTLASSASSGELQRALYVGLKLDVRLALLISVPYLVLIAIPALNPMRRTMARRGWLLYFAVVEALVLLLYAVDVGHYDYVRARLNASVLEHLRPVRVAMQMVWESYPVVWGLLGLGALAAAYFYLVRHVANRVLSQPADSAISRPRKALAVTLTAFLCLLGIYGKWSWYPLRWSDAYFSGNEFVSALALNPVLFLIDTTDNPSQPFDVAKVRENYPLVANLLGVQKPDAQALSFARYVKPAPIPGPKPNLVVIHLESFAAFKVGVMGNRLNATPNFDAIARESLLFDDFFVPAVPTARSVFTMVTGIPDYNPGDSSSRNPLIVHQHTLINALTDYEHFYFLGGSASWGNIRGLLTQSVERLNVFEEGDYDATPVDTWGITDHDLFRKAHEVLKKRSEPFFAFIQTAGNHRPFTIPPTNPYGFERVQMDERLLRANGFDSLAAYNGLRFLDHAIGYFFEQARKEPYFKNTIFVLYGDHGNPAANDIPYQRLGLTGFHVPMIIYAPGRIRHGRRISTVASLVDLLPTTLSLMGVPHVNNTLGRDLLAARPAREHLALLPEGILTDEFLLRLDPRGARLYRYRSTTPTKDVSSEQPEKVAELQRLRAALYETSKYLLRHNAPRPHTQ
ncbi:MAG: LTA synthase family protein [Sulfurifustaceae bacterium]